MRAATRWKLLFLKMPQSPLPTCHFTLFPLTRMLFSSVFNSSGHILRSGIAGWYGNSALRFLRKHGTISTAAAPFYIPTSKRTRVPIFPRPHQHLLYFLVFALLFFMSNLVTVKWYPLWGFGLFFFNLFIWLHWVFIAVHGLSLVTASEGYSLLRCAGFSLRWRLLLQSTGSRHAGSVVVAHGLSCSAACGIFPDQGSIPRPLHWQADS